MKTLAFDLGAGSGRTVVGTLQDDVLRMAEVHRFSNEPVHLGPRLHWDFLRLLHEVKRGFVLARQAGHDDITSFGVDSWATDFGLLDEGGELLANPYHYRDAQTEGVTERLCAEFSKERIYRNTGIQFLTFNTIYQLYALRERRPELLRQAARLLFIPDLFRYYLTGQSIAEFTMATTTQLYNPFLHDWDPELTGLLRLQNGLLGEVTQPARQVGVLTAEVSRELGFSSIPMMAVGEHDTASAVVAVPSHRPHFAFLSSGTWSLMGTEVTKPVVTEAAERLNFTNEGGVAGTFRLLKNIMGLWLLQSCLRVWSDCGQPVTLEEALARAEQSPAFGSWIDPDAADFFAPDDMPEAIRSFCLRTGQLPPEGPGEMVRCILESLAFRYRSVLDQIERLTGRRYEELHVVGGGSQNAHLCQFTANAIGRPVLAGPAEATAIGNLVVQFMGLGAIRDLSEGRSLVRRSFTIVEYKPMDTSGWEEAYARFAARFEPVPAGGANQEV